MPRPPLAVGTFGAINFLLVGKGRVRAQVSFPDFDGRRRSPADQPTRRVNNLFGHNT